MDGQPTDFVDRPMEMSHHSMGIISPLMIITIYVSRFVADYSYWF